MGIGTTTPGKTVDVNGTVALGFQGGSALAIQPSNNGASFWTNASYDRTNPTSGWANILTLNGSNVGIGATSPVGKLHISGTSFRPSANVSGGLVLDGNWGGGLIFKDTAYAGIWTMDYGHTLNFSTNGSTNGFGSADYGQVVIKDGSLGVGTMGPLTPLSVNANNWIAGGESPLVTSQTGSTALGGMYVTAESVGGYSGLGFKTLFGGGDGLATRLYINHTGNVGIGTVSPGYKLQVAGEVASIGNNNGFRVNSLQGDNVNAAPWYGMGLSNLTLNGQPSTAVQVAGFYGLNFQTAWGQMVMLPNGNVGLGTAAPSTKLDVAGTVKAGAVTFPDGSTQQTAWTGVLCGGDYAESVDVTGKKAQYEPGDVMVIDKKNPGRFVKAAEPYSRLVAGIYSTKPGAVGRRSSDAEKAKEEVPMAMVGIVPTKVSAENGPIETGDLLVTSSTQGYAMKATDFTRATGAIVGKALGPLDSGTGVIDVLVSLQ